MYPGNRMYLGSCSTVLWSELPMLPSYPHYPHDLLDNLFLEDPSVTQCKFWERPTPQTFSPSTFSNPEPQTT